MDDRTALQQTHTTTFAGRNVELMKDVRTYLEEAGRLQGAKVLSFGCSTGEECMDLAETMPGAKIYGADINEKALAKALTQCPKDIDIFLSAESGFVQRGPFDAIFAMSVFCKWPKTIDMTDIAEVYPFDVFEQGILTLDRHLKEGGILCLYNAQYMFDDTRVSPHYSPLSRALPWSSGWMYKCTPDGRRATSTTYGLDGEEYTSDEWVAYYKANPGCGRGPNGEWLQSVFHKWHDDSLRAHRQPDVALWRKVSR